MWNPVAKAQLRALHKNPSAILLLRPIRQCRARNLSLPRPQQRTFSSKPSDPAAQPSPAAPNLRERWFSTLEHSWASHSHQLTYPFRAYGRAQDKRPYVTQICSSLVIYFAGDLLSQYINRSSSTPVASEQSSGPAAPSTKDEAQDTGFHYNRERGVRALIIGGIFSIPSYRWFLFLSHNFNLPATIPRAHIWSLGIKVLVAQVFFAPFFNSYFFGMQSLLSSSPSTTQAGDPIESKLSERYLQAKLELAWIRIRDTVPVSWYNSCKFWPFATAFSFTFIQPRNRSVFAGLLAVGWQSYLGLVNQRAVEKARREARAIA